jgi:hypothetical protein
MAGYCGVDARPLTFRELNWMYREKRRVSGELVAYQIAWIARMLGGGNIDPQDINPYGERRPVKVKPKAMREAENRVGWKLLQRGILGRVMFEPKEI